MFNMRARARDSHRNFVNCLRYTHTHTCARATFVGVGFNENSTVRKFMRQNQPKTDDRKATARTRQHLIETEMKPIRLFWCILR